MKNQVITLCQSACKKNDARMTKSKNKLVQQQIRNNQIIRPISEIFGLDKRIIRTKFL